MKSTDLTTDGVLSPFLQRAKMPPKPIPFPGIYPGLAPGANRLSPFQGFAQNLNAGEIAPDAKVICFIQNFTVCNSNMKSLVARTIIENETSFEFMINQTDNGSLISFLQRVSFNL